MNIKLEERVRRFFDREVRESVHAAWLKESVSHILNVGRGKRTVERYGSTLTLKDGDRVLGRYRLAISVRIFRI